MCATCVVKHTGFFYNVEALIIDAAWLQIHARATALMLMFLMPIAIGRGGERGVKEHV